ncbi:hypothetical protein OC844_004949 [Tilletia horrida]|nr:hypothetical protein OC844_004949 [Tilletia horrida]
MNTQKAGRGRGSKRVLFDATRSSKRVVQAVKLGRPETVYQKVLSEAEQAEELSARQRGAVEVKRRRTQHKLDELEKTNYRDAAPDKPLLMTPVEGTQALSANLASILAARREGIADRERTVTHDLELQAAIEASGRTSSKKEHWTPAVRKILTTRRTFGSLISDAAEFPSMHAAPNYFTAQAPRASRSSTTMCSICGYWGTYGCVQCGERYCSRKCGTT